LVLSPSFLPRLLKKGSTSAHLSLETSLNSLSVVTILVPVAVELVVLAAVDKGRGGATWALKPARRTNWPAEEAKLRRTKTEKACQVRFWSGERGRRMAKGGGRWELRLSPSPRFLPPGDQVMVRRTHAPKKALYGKLVTRTQ
jgi:hypothetical protein